MDLNSNSVNSINHLKSLLAILGNFLKKNMDLNSNSVNSINYLKSLLANNISNCMGKELDIAFIKSCAKWAENRNENEIFNGAPFIPGKAKAVHAKVQPPCAIS